MDLLQTLEIPNFPLRYKASNKRKKKYWKASHSNRPKKYKHLTETDKKGYLLDEDGNRVVKNPVAAGTPRYISLSGNNFTTGLHHSVRSKIVHFLKDFYMPFVQTMKPFDKFPIQVEWEFHSPVEVEFDMSNFWFYYKYFEDCLFEEKYKGRDITPIMPDDNRKYVTKPGAPELWPVDDIEDRKFVFRFYHDQRNIIKDHDLWQPKNKNSN